MPMSAQDLADKLSPKIKEYLLNNEDFFVNEAGNVLERSAMRLAFPTFLHRVPDLTRSIIGMVSDEFGSMNVNDLIAFLNEHVKSRSLGE